MKHLLICWLLFSPALLPAQSKIPLVTAVDMRFNAGVGISNKPNVLFGAPFTLSGELSVLFRDQWRVALEAGALAFRDVKYPEKISGWGWFVGRSRYEHAYYGLLIGRVVFSTERSQKLTLSSGADYLLIADPNITIKNTALWRSVVFDYRYEWYLNVPIQLDYSIAPFARKRTRIVFVGRWNANAYHSFPTASIGVDLPIYPLADR